LFQYQTAPGNTAAAPVIWPPESRLKRPTDQSTLLMFVHPQCPCTRASIGELALLMAACRGHVQAYVLFYAPKGAANNWTKTELCANAARIPGVVLLADEDGEQAARFHATTSGQTMLYDEQGRLQFSGGITAGRGHSGDNAGRAAIVALASAGKSGLRQTPVYGCSLRASSFNSPTEKICCKK
jgi:hypothetical protein